jgi:hypothetical protein
MQQRRRTGSEGRHLKRLPASTFDPVSPKHIADAVSSLLKGVDHPFGESTDYDLITPEGERLPPKAVFGVAAQTALGREILPEHFTGGEKTRCFRMLRNGGFDVVPKTVDRASEG